MQSETLSFTTDDGIPIHVRAWAPDAAPRGIVQILHGLAEHAARYERLAGALTAAGWAVITHDHRGHGGSVRDERDRGHFADHDGWTLALADVERVAQLARERWPGAPVVLLGHSMGSTLAIHRLFTRPGAVDAAVLSGPVGIVGPMRALGLGLTAVIRRLTGVRARSRLLHALSFGDFNKAFAPARTEYDWLSRDPAEVDKYANDPLCGFVVTTQHWFDHLVALGEIARVENLRRIPADLPIYVFAGTQDPVSKGTRQLDPWIRRLQQAGARRVDVRFYPEGRHELFNEVNRDEVVRDLLEWLDEHVPAAAAQTAAG